MKNQRGFTMMEIIVSLALIGLVVVAILQGLALTAKTSPMVDMKVTGMNIAESQMEFIRVQDYSIPPAQYGTINLAALNYDPRFSMNISVTSVDGDYDGTLDNELQEIVVTVLHTTGGGTVTRVATLESYRALQ